MLEPYEGKLSRTVLRGGRSGNAPLPLGAVVNGDTLQPYLISLVRMYNRTYNRPVTYEWDPPKADANFRKHKIHFADAVAVFSDDSAMTIEDEHEEENRFVTLGMDAFARTLVVVYTWRGEDIRLISARKATASEREQYLQGL